MGIEKTVRENFFEQNSKENHFCFKHFLLKSLFFITSTYEILLEIIQGGSCPLTKNEAKWMEAENFRTMFYDSKQLPSCYQDVLIFHVPSMPNLFRT